MKRIVAPLINLTLTVLLAFAASGINLNARAAKKTAVTHIAANQQLSESTSGALVGGTRPAWCNDTCQSNTRACTYFLIGMGVSPIGTWLYILYNCG
jgi:hypothetical protein